jgi:hypothetical protein
MNHNFLNRCFFLFLTLLQYYSPSVRSKGVNINVNKTKDNLTTVVYTQMYLSIVLIVMWPLEWAIWANQKCETKIFYNTQHTFHFSCWQNPGGMHLLPFWVCRSLLVLRGNQTRSLWLTPIINLLRRLRLWKMWFEASMPKVHEIFITNSWAQWYTSAISATWQADIKRIAVQSQSR